MKTIKSYYQWHSEFDLDSNGEKGKIVDVFFYLRGNRYGSDLDYFKKLAKEARNDFPNLKDSDIEIVTFDGPAIKGICGIKFLQSKASYSKYIPENYIKCLDQPALIIP